MIWIYIINTQLLGTLRISDDLSPPSASEGAGSTVAVENSGQTKTKTRGKSKLGARPKERYAHLQPMNEASSIGMVFLHAIYLL